MNKSVSCILGVDPGLTGACAFYYPDEPGLIAVEDMPVAAGDLDPAKLARRLRQILPTVAIVERVASRPGQGVASVFNFGRGYGTVLGVIAALDIPQHFVTPSAWKKHFGLSAEKEDARALAVRLWPRQSERFERKKDAGRAEAALIARWFAETKPALAPVRRAA